ncbi:MAG: putative glycosyltransferase [Actinomycetia bacterium]|nr:putative glycosyltransferase [Actinomycetes bacterium]
MPEADRPLRVALLTYRGKPHCGGQGVYTRHLSKALTDLGHHVEVYSGQPYPVLDPRVTLHKLPSLDMWEHFPFHVPWPWQLHGRIDVAEAARTLFTGTFAEPWAFSARAAKAIIPRVGEFDILHDNQCMGSGLLDIQAAGLPILGTIHHPITVDRRIDMESAPNAWRRFGASRFYAFTKMQSKVAQQLPRIMTVSENSFGDIVTGHGVDPDKMRVVNVGVDPELFRPLPHIERVPGRLMTTSSSDVPMKGLVHLLEAVAKLRVERPDVRLTVIGKPNPGGPVMRTIERFDLLPHIDFVSGVEDERIVELYAEAELAIIPSLYEGFSLPAIEAMASGVPVVATTGGAIPEVVGRDGTTAALVPPADAGALAHTIGELLDDPARRAAIGQAGRNRVIERWSWTVTAEKTIDQYREVIEIVRGR